METQSGTYYVGKLNNTPGYVTTKDKKVEKIKVEAERVATVGHILVKRNPNVQVQWISLRRNDRIPSNAIEVGRDHANDITFFFFITGF
jgi:hypothetical protein